MAWIREAPTPPSSDDDQGRELLRLRKLMRDPETGKVDNILAVHSLHPGGMAAHYALYLSVMAGTKTLRKVDREMIALVVSRINECHY